MGLGFGGWEIGFRVLGFGVGFGFGGLEFRVWVTGSRVQGFKD